MTAPVHLVHECDDNNKRGEIMDEKYILMSSSAEL
jgi:hypothetical protein